MNSFLTGLATGLAIGYLTAPRSGKETRDQLSNAVTRQTQGLTDQWTKTASLVNQLVGDVKTQSGIIKEDLTVFADITGERIDQYKSEFGQIKAEATTAYNDKVTQTADGIRSGAAATEYALKQ